MESGNPVASTREEEEAAKRKRELLSIMDRSFADHDRTGKRQKRIYNWLTAAGLFRIRVSICIRRSTKRMDFWR